MCEDYGSCSLLSVCLSLCLSVTTLAATHLVFKSQMKCNMVLYDILYGVLNRCIELISLKMLCSKVLGVVYYGLGCHLTPDEFTMDMMMYEHQ